MAGKKARANPNRKRNNQDVLRTKLRKAKRVAKSSGIKAFEKYVEKHGSITVGGSPMSLAVTLPAKLDEIRAKCARLNMR